MMVDCRNRKFSWRMREEWIALALCSGDVVGSGVVALEFGTRGRKISEYVKGRRRR